MQTCADLKMELEWPMTHIHVAVVVKSTSSLRSSSLAFHQNHYQHTLHVEMGAALLPEVEISFGASSGAWDDRALIAACDAAMEEFHVSF